MVGVCIIVPVHNALEHVQGLTSQLVATVRKETPVIVVDDASDPDTQEFAKGAVAANPCWSYLRNRRQQLFTRTVNRGIRACEPDIPFICECNTDLLLQPGWLEELLSIMEEHPDCGICGYDKPNQKPELLELTEPQTYITGHCILLRRKMLEQIGMLMETDVGGPNTLTHCNALGQAHQASERILCWRARKAGWKLYETHKPLVVHGNGPSWNRNLSWLNSFPREQLWPGRDTL